MKTNRSWIWALWLVGALIVLALGTAPILADSGGQQSGPIYSLPEATAYAQAILMKDGYLQPGGYAKGIQDEPTLRAVSQFQRDHFLRPSGQIDQDTMALLTTHGPAADPGAADAGRENGTGVATATGQPARTMPVTDSPLTMQIALGALLAAGGAALLLRRFI